MSYSQIYKPSSYLTGDTLRLHYRFSRLILCEILGFHGGNYEVWRLLDYKTSVLTSQETLRLRYRVQPVNAM
jgi:hypothetical protein